MSASLNWAIGFLFGAILFFIDFKIIIVISSNLLSFAADGVDKTNPRKTKQKVALSKLLLFIAVLFKLAGLYLAIYVALAKFSLDAFAVFAGALMALIFSSAKFFFSHAMKKSHS